MQQARGEGLFWGATYAFRKVAYWQFSGLNALFGGHRVLIPFN